LAGPNQSDDSGSHGSIAADAAARAFRSLTGVIASGVVLTRDKHIVWANDRFAELTGNHAADDAVGRVLADWFTDTGGGLPDSVAPRAVECGLERPGGELRTVICRPADASGEAWVIDDVSHVRRLEAELLRVSKELHGANRENAKLSDRVGRESDEREELLTVVSHELRTPVTIISGYARLLLSEQVGPLTDEQRRFLQESSKGCQRLNAFIGNLLEAARSAPDGEVLEISHAPVGPVVAAVVALLDPMLESAGLVVELAIDPNADRARFDRLRLEQILTNLLGNAIKFSPAGGTIRIATRALEPASSTDRASLEISVCDEGPGVARSDRARIFEPYIQVGEQRGAGGLGLGLAICKRLVEAHGGSISVRPRQQGGSEFAFTLPVVEDAANRTNRGEA
jgi:signal transduction histidine kinase